MTKSFNHIAICDAKQVILHLVNVLKISLMGKNPVHIATVVTPKRKEDSIFLSTSSASGKTIGGGGIFTLQHLLLQ